MSQPLATIDEVATLMRTTPAALYSQRHRNEPPGRLGVKVGRKILWDVEQLHEWFLDQQRDSR